MRPSGEFAQQVYHLIADLPDALVKRLAETLAAASSDDWPHLRARVLQVIPQQSIYRRVEEFLVFWQTRASDIRPESVALALMAASAAVGHQRQTQKLELVWTGPDTQVIPLRRTEQALLQVIDEAQRSLHIVSFAVYKIESIVRALIGAAGRGVDVSVYLETPDSGQGKIAFDTIGSLGSKILDCACVYVWPIAQREQLSNGKYGSLHAKVAIADGQAMLISSANLTEYAMLLNMEMGILIHGGILPGQVESHLERLVEAKVFQPVS